MNREHGKRYQAVHARAERALLNLYHNATLPPMRDLYGRSEDYAQSWLEDQCQFEIEYLRDGGSTPGDYRACLAAPCNAGRYKSERAREYYIRKGMRARDMERADCGALTGYKVLERATRKAQGKSVFGVASLRNLGDRRHNAQWERITEYGKLYQYGRGGRTLAPDGLWKENGCGHGANRDALELPMVALVELIRVVESFNAYVESWCAGVPDMWRADCAGEDAQVAAEKRQATARKARETRERNYWAARDVLTVAA